jgi:hypothetical protein
MSTEINIKKRIDIQEEGVSITPDVNSINFTGDGVTASAIGDDVTVNIPGGMGTTTYYLNESVTQTPYKEFTSTLTASPEQTIVTSIASGATVTIQSFQTPSGVPGTTNIPGGRWAFYLHFSGTTGDSWDVFAEVYKRDLGGIETLLLTTDAVPTSTLTGAAVMLLTDGVFPTSTVLTTDRIVVKVRVTNTDVTTNSITFHTEGNTNYSIATTTLNQVITAGSVTSVTGTAPIASSGGAAPAISISQSGAASDGYLSSTDWNTFNNKVDDNIYTADGTLGGNRTVTMAGNTLNLSGGNVGINTTPTQLLDVNGVTRHRGNVNMDNGAGIVWNDLTGIFPTSVNSRISWTLNNDRAEIYAWQPSSNDIDFVFKLRDDVTTTTDNYVFWMQDNAGEAADRYPLEMSGPAFVVNALRRYATLPANANSGNTDFYVLKENATGLTDSLIFGDVSATRVGINTSSPTETLDVNGKTKTTTFQLTTTPTAGHVLTSDASGNGTWQANGNGTVTSVELSAGTGISLAGTNPITSSGTITVTNSAPDQTVVLNAGTGIGVTGTYPNFTISNTDPTTGVTLTSSGGANSLVNDGTGPSLAVKGLTAGSGILIGSTATTVSIVNSNPDQTVVLNSGTGINVTGTYPNFTIDNTVSDTNIYNSDGTITGPRSLDLNAQPLAFTDITANGQFSVNMDDGSTKGVDFVVNKAFNSWNNFNNVTGEASGIIITPEYTRLEAVDPIAAVTRNLEVKSAGVEINSQYTLPNGAGSAGQVITSTTLGSTAFQPLPAEVQAAASDETTNLTTGTAKVTFRMPHRMTLTAVRASLTTAQTAGALLTVDINLNGVSVLGTKLTFDNGERTTVTAATPATIVTSDLTDDGEITVDIDTVGTALAKGLKITLIGTRA